MARDEIKVTDNYAAFVARLNAWLYALEIGQGSNVIGFVDKTAMDADLAHADGTVAYVTNDAAAANNGTWRKSGASGAGSWVQASYDRVALVEDDVSRLKADPYIGEALGGGVETGDGVDLINSSTTYTNGYKMGNSSDVLVADALMTVTGFIRVQPSTTYTKTVNVNSNGGYFTIGKGWIANIYSTDPYGTAESEFTTPADCYFVRLNFLLTHPMSFIEGTIATPTGIKSFPWMRVDSGDPIYAALASETAELRAGPYLSDSLRYKAETGDGFNLINSSINFTDNFYLDPNNVELAAVGWTITNLIRVKPSTTYTKSSNATSGNGGTFDENGAWIAGIPSGGSVGDTIEFTTPAGCYFLRLNYQIADTKTLVEGTIAAPRGMVSLPWLVTDPLDPTRILAESSAVTLATHSSELVGTVYEPLVASNLSGSGYTVDSITADGTIDITRVGKSFPFVLLDPSFTSMIFTKGSRYLIIAGDQTTVIAVTLDGGNTGSLFRWTYATDSFAGIGVNIGNGAESTPGSEVIDVKLSGSQLVVTSAGVTVVDYDLSALSISTYPELATLRFGWVAENDLECAVTASAVKLTAIGYLRKAIGNDPQAIVTGGLWSPDTWASLGDSITAPGTYQADVLSLTGLTTVENLGVSGSTIVNVDANSMVNLYTSITGTPDLITVFGGTNDFGLNKTLGVIGSTLDTEFYGAVDILMNALISAYPSSRIIFITPMHRDYLGGGLINGNGDHLDDFCQAIREVGALNSVPVVDLYRELGVSFSNLNTYTNDRLHPNTLGHAKVANMIAARLKELPF